VCALNYFSLFYRAIKGREDHAARGDPRLVSELLPTQGEGGGGESSAATANNKVPQAPTHEYELVVCHGNVIRYFVCRCACVRSRAIHTRVRMRVRQLARDTHTCAYACACACACACARVHVYMCVGVRSMLPAARKYTHTHTHTYTHTYTHTHCTYGCVSWCARA
jgi:hypothetical protein